MKKVVLAALVLLAVSGIVFAGGAKQAGGVEAVKKTGVLKVGVKADVPNFGLQNPATGLYEGLEIEIAKLFAKDIFGDASKVAFTPVTAKTRGPLIDTGELDMIIATFTITEERKLTYNFSTPYYNDAVGLLVKKSSGIKSVADLNGKTVGVAQSATSRKAVEDAAALLGVKPLFSEFATYPEIKAALDSGRVQVFSVDKSILAGYLDAESEILPDAFSPQDYGVVTRLNNKSLAEYAEAQIQKWLKDGTITGLVRQFGL
jgi:putative glutamine transport system substrate-binding protein